MKQPVIIEDDIKMVSSDHSGRYPFDKMKVCQSIHFGSRSAAKAAAERANTRHPPNKYEAGFDGNGSSRVWRME